MITIKAINVILPSAEMRRNLTLEFIRSKMRGTMNARPKIMPKLMSARYLVGKFSNLIKIT
ncbi:MAG: hypothetical protein ACW986_10150 [Promethearchaeota archaeon]